MIFTQDATYVRVGGPWKKTNGSAATRHSQLERALNAQPLHDCGLVGEQEIGGVRTSVFKYEQGSDAPVSMKIWVGSGDGLPYQWQAGSTLSKIEYTGVAVPTGPN